MPRFIAARVLKAIVLVHFVLSNRSPAADELVAGAERARVEMIARAAPSVVCVYDDVQHGSGSGVLIDADGYGLTNFHVVARMLDSRRGFGGLSDGQFYPMTVLGVDPTGDVAMFRLQGEQPFPFATLGDSDQIRVGDTAVAMGNPFILSEDQTPSVTLGIVTGVHRYQWGEGGSTLVYSDCIQIDTPINPGNSGGPLFNAGGEIIGINGRISVGTRGRFNVGHGYAITSNQIARFVPALRAGLIAKHGTLQATVEDLQEGGVVLNMVRPGCAADKAGVRSGDRLMTVDGAPINTPNEFASALGAYPADWPLRLSLERDGRPLEIIARLDAIPLQLKQPITVDGEMNREAVRSALRRFQKGVLGEAPQAPGHWAWCAQRVRTDQADEKEKRIANYECSYTVGGSMVLRRKYPDGSYGGRIEVDATRVAQSYEGMPETFDLPPDEVMILRTLYLVRDRLLAPIDTLDLTHVSHAGGEPSTDSPSGRFPRMFELIEWPLSEDATVHFAVDPSNGHLMKIDVFDKKVNARGTILLSAFREREGITWPTVFEVTTPTERYRETITEWEFKP